MSSDASGYHPAPQHGFGPGPITPRGARAPPPREALANMTGITPFLLRNNQSSNSLSRQNSATTPRPSGSDNGALQ